MSALDVGVGLALLAWALVVGISLEDRVLSWYVRRCHGDAQVAVAFCLGLALALTVVGLGLAAAVTALGEGSTAAALVYLPVALVVAPLAVTLMPSGVGWSLPGDLRRAGAPPAVVRGSVVGAFVVLVLALVILFAGFFTTFGRS